MRRPYPTAIPPLNPSWLLRAARRNLPAAERTMVMDEITEEPAALVERIAALDIGKAALTACVRVPHEDKPGARRQQVRTHAVSAAFPMSSAAMRSTSAAGSSVMSSMTMVLSAAGRFRRAARRSQEGFRGGIAVG